MQTMQIILTISFQWIAIADVQISKWHQKPRVPEKGGENTFPACIKTDITIVVALILSVYLYLYFVLELYEFSSIANNTVCFNVLKLVYRKHKLNNKTA